MNIQQSEKFFEKAKIFTPGGVHSPVRGFRGVGGVPRFIRSASGAELEDVDGNRYIDHCMSWGPLIFGHQEPEAMEAVQNAIRRGWSYGAAEPYSLELAEFLCTNLPWLEKVRFVNSGTEAVMSALRLARAATQRNKIMKFDGCYHGHVDSMLVRAGSGLADMASPDSAGISEAVAGDTVVAPLGDLEFVERLFEIHGRNIAAVILEPVPANNGLLLQTDEFLKGVANLARRAGALVIFDEVITGFRVAFGGMAERTGIRPDLVTYGKIIGGGFPVGAFGGRADLLDLIAPTGPVYQAGTLSANPVAMAAGLATVRKLKRENPYAALEEKTSKLASRLEAVGEELGFPIRVPRTASIFWTVLGVKPSTEIRHPAEVPPIHKELYSKSFHLLLEKGIYLAPSAFEVSFLSTAHSDAQIDRLVAAVREAVQEVLRAR